MQSSRTRSELALRTGNFVSKSRRAVRVRVSPAVIIIRWHMHLKVIVRSSAYTCRGKRLSPFYCRNNFCCCWDCCSIWMRFELLAARSATQKSWFMDQSEIKFLNLVHKLACVCVSCSSMTLSLNCILICQINIQSNIYLHTQLVKNGCTYCKKYLNWNMDHHRLTCEVV